MTPDELKTAFAALPPMDPVKPAHNWTFWAWDLRQNVLNNDITEFLTWPGVVGTMFVGNAPYIRFEGTKLNYTYRQVIKEPRVGNPSIYLYGGKGIESSGNLIHQAYHLVQWQHTVKRHYGDLDDLDTIVEVGGGYGAMALICHRLGFRGRYIILDLPEFSLLQRYYLSNVGVGNVEFRTQIDELIDCDLLIGLYSLNEMPLHIRETIIDLCPAQSYLIAYGANWGGWDNVAWAGELMKRKGYNWHNWNIEHLPNCWYLVGDKRE